MLGLLLLSIKRLFSLLQTTNYTNVDSFSGSPDTASSSSAWDMQSPQYNIKTHRYALPIATKRTVGYWYYVTNACTNTICSSTHFPTRERLDRRDAPYEIVQDDLSQQSAAIIEVKCCCFCFVSRTAINANWRVHQRTYSGQHLYF